jgi:hypothetical protein
LQVRFEPELQGLLRLVLDGMARRREAVAAGAGWKGHQQILPFPGHDCRVAHRHISISFSLYRLKTRSSHVERDEMPYIRVGGLIRFVPSQLRDWTFAKDQGKG